MRPLVSRSLVFRQQENVVVHSQAIQVRLTKGEGGGTLTVSALVQGAPRAAHFELPEPAVDLGLDRPGPGEPPVTVPLDNSGDLASVVAVGPTPAWLHVTAPAEAGPGRSYLNVTIDRATAPGGQFEETVSIAPVDGTGGGELTVSGSVDDPVVASIELADDVIYATSCLVGESYLDTTTVTVSVASVVGVQSVTVLMYEVDLAGSGRSVRLPAVFDGEIGSFVADVPSSEVGLFAFKVTATDVFGRSVTDANDDIELEVFGCPSPEPPLSSDTVTE